MASNLRRPALQDSRQRDMAGTAGPVHLSAPVLGWNTRDPVAAMKPLYALQLDNWFPMEGECQLRSGFTEQASGMGSTTVVKSLAAYQSKDATSKLFACTDDGIYDVTAVGAVGAVAFVLTNGFWDSVNFTNSAGNSFLWGCNGADDVGLFDGTNWTALNGASVPAITNITTASIVSPWVFKRRIFFIEKHTMNAWYLPVDSIAGAASKLPIGALFKRGGYLVAGTSWTVDGGDGSDDLCVFITSEGEIAVYQGINPDSSSSWSLVGVYYVGRPTNRRCFEKLGSDVAVLTEIGLLPLSKALVSAGYNRAVALSDAIRPSILAQMRANFAESGWQVHLHAPRNALMLNIPQGSDIAGLETFIQYVMNTITGAWCSFSSWNAACFLSFNGSLYFGGSDGTVQKCWDDDVPGDGGDDIVGTVQYAFNTFGAAGRIKKLLQFRPMITIDNQIHLGWGFISDYRIPNITSRFDSPIGNFSYWDIAMWDVSFWSQEPFRFLSWLTASSIEGYAFSVLLQVTTQSASVSWSGTDFLLQAGGLL